MAREDEVLNDILRLLDETELGDRLQLLVGRWLEDGLPSRPVRGRAGRDQLAHAAGLLRETATELGSLAAIALEFPNRPVVFVGDGDVDRPLVSQWRPTDDDDASDEVLEWATLLIAVANTVDDFIGLQDDGNRR